jgi:Lipocalin-like domain
VNKLKLVMVILAIVALSCKDDDNDALSTETMLSVEKGWKITAHTIDPAYPLGNGTTISNWYAQYEDCEKDDVLIFVAAGTYRSENPVKCDNTEPSIRESGNWTLSSDKKTLKFSPTGDTQYEVTLASIDKTTLKITFADTDDGVKYTNTITFTAQ